MKITKILLIIGLFSNLLFYSCSSEQLPMDENLLIEEKSLLIENEDLSFEIDKSFSSNNRSFKSENFDCANSTLLTRYAYNNAPIFSKYKYRYGKTTFMVIKERRTGSFNERFRVLGKCEDSITLLNPEIVGKWRIINSNNLPDNIDPELTFTISKEGKVTMKGCNTFFGVTIYDYKKSQNTFGTLRFKTNHVGATRMGCHDKKDEHINIVIDVLPKLTYWLKTYTSSGKTRLSFMEDPLSRFLGDPILHLESL